MQTIVYYFSGTGNSLVAARDLASQLGEAQLVPIAKLLRETKVEPQAERIGIVYPVYMWGMPRIVVDFAKKLKLNPGQYVFGLATYGGMVGAALLQLDQLLRRKGTKLSAGFGLLMPGNYTPLYGAIPVPRQEKMFKQEKEKIKLIAQTVSQAKRHKIEKSFFLINWLFYGIIYRTSSPRIPEMDRSFWTQEQCNHCGLCQRICPVKNIQLVNGMPSWLHHCEQCLACLHWCPQEAIQFGKSTISRQRYHHPEVKQEDLL